MSFILSIHPTDILMGVGIAALIKFVVYTKGKNAKKFRQGKEYGSARWGTTKIFRVVYNKVMNGHIPTYEASLKY